MTKTAHSGHGLTLTRTPSPEMGSDASRMGGFEREPEGLALAPSPTSALRVQLPRKILRALQGILAGFLFLSGVALRAELGIRPPFEPEPDQIALLQRTLTLLQTSTPERRNPVRVLVYGQSISQQAWWTEVAGILRTTYPHADLTIENRAISGMQAAALSRSAHTDVIPFHPDLILFQAYGDEAGMDRFLSTIRSLTTSEILLQGDHIYDTNWVHEETDPGKVPSTDFWPHRNYVWLPRLAKQYGACFIPVRTFWKRYLLTNGITERALLTDVHLNTDGNRLLAELILRHLKPREFQPPMDPFETRTVQTLPLGPGFGWKGGVLEAEFTGGQIRAVYDHTAAAPIRVEIDGRDPASFPELYGTTRVSAVPYFTWPAILWVKQQVPLIDEEWTVRPLEMSRSGDRFTFEVTGSVTGPDGIGTNQARFISNSRRVVIDPGDWNLGLAVYFSGSLPPKDYQAIWRPVRQFRPELHPVFFADPVREASEAIAFGLSDQPHRIRLIASDGKGGGIRALRVHSASGNASLRPLPWVSRIGDVSEIHLPAGAETSKLEFSPTLDPGVLWTPVPTPETGTSSALVRRHTSPGDGGYYRLVPTRPPTPISPSQTPPE